MSVQTVQPASAHVYGQFADSEDGQFRESENFGPELDEGEATHNSVEYTGLAYEVPYGTILGNVPRTMSVTELYRPHRQAIIKFFKAMKKNVNNCYTTSQVESILNGYIARNKLAIGGSDSRTIRLDDFLRYIAFPEYGGREVPDDQKNVTRKTLYTRVTSRMQASYILEVDGVKRDEVKGQLEPITVFLKGKKTRLRTVIRGFTPFEIDADTLAKEVSYWHNHRASAGTVPEKETEEQVTIHGNSCDDAVDILARLGVPRQWIKVQKAKHLKNL